MEGSSEKHSQTIQLRKLSLSMDYTYKPQKDKYQLYRSKIALKQAWKSLESSNIYFCYEPLNHR